MTRILAVFLSSLLFPMSISVEACVFNPVPELSNAKKGYWSRQQTQHRHRQASERLALGHVDVSSELAELLIPNIRPVRIEKSSCGPLGEVDFANGEPRLFGEELYADRRLGKTSPRIMREKARSSTVGGVFGEACNLEFRQRFSAWLKGRIPEEKLQEIWKFLLARQRESGNYGSIYARLMAFEGETRQPPVRWIGADKWIDRDIRTFVTKRTNGRLLASAISSFWAAHQQLLSSDDLACPVAERSWEAEKERIIAAILSQERAVIPGAR